MKLPWLDPSPLQVFAVEPGALQLTWGHLPRGQVTIRPNNQQPISMVHDGGPGALVLQNLKPGFRDLEIRHPDGVSRLSAVIPEPPRGEELYRIATISDLHLGSGNWGALRTIRDIAGDGSEHYDLRCASAAIAEAVEWGARLLIIQGDAAHHRRTRDFDLVDELVDRFPRLPMLMIPGNHDVDNAWPIEVPETFGKRALPMEMHVDVHDLPGVRVIIGNTTIEHAGRGTIKGVAGDLLEAAESSSTQNLMALHHQFQRFPVATYWPPGIPSGEGKQFLRKLGRLAPDTLVTSGHAHRHRARRVGSLLVTETGSTKDWPGTWTGYRIYETGMYQTVRRVAAPSAIAWTEHSRRALLGLWSPWSPGSLEDRCVAL